MAFGAGTSCEVAVAFFRPADCLSARVAEIRRILAAPAPAGYCGGHSAIRKPESNFTKKNYLAAVNKVKRYIVEGDIFQACLSQRFKTGFTGDAWQVYCKLNRINPAPFSAYVDFAGVKIISSSPELFLHAKSGSIWTKPMKGTMPRGKDAASDRRLRERLLDSIKDDAELSMIVDLERNDLGKICKPGSVKVIKHREIEKYASVYQTTSLVFGKLNNRKISVEEIIRATFPGGSISGCPKIRAMEIIDEIEPTARSVYTGALGYVSFHDTLCLNIAIRTMIAANKKLYFQVGGGIVADSDASAEYAETLAKGKSMMDTLENL
jgi:para-aminobenzoate synthetase component 1